MGHEIIPDILDRPPQYPLELTYKTVRTFPGMQLTADMTRFKPMLHWPAKNNALYTVVMSNLDINNRRNRQVSTYLDARFYYSCKSLKLQLRLFLTPFWSLFWMQSEIFKGAKRWFLKVKKKCQQQSTNHSIIHASQGLKKKNLTQVFSVASFLYSPFFLQGSEKVSLCRDIHQKKFRDLFFRYGARSFLVN